MFTDLILEITHEGQREYDEPEYATMLPRADTQTALAVSIRAAFGIEGPRVLHEIVGYRRVSLNWIKA